MGACLEEASVGAGVESGVDGGAAAEDPATDIVDTIKRGEGLSGVVGDVASGLHKKLEEAVLGGSLGIIMVVSTSLQE